MRLQLPRLAWNALAALIACGWQIVDASTRCVCRPLSRASRAWKRLDAALDSMGDKVDRSAEEAGLRGTWRAVRVGEALIGASHEAERLHKAITCAAAREEGARDAVRSAALIALAALSEADRKIVRFRRTLVLARAGEG